MFIAVRVCKAEFTVQTRSHPMKKLLAIGLAAALALPAAVSMPQPAAAQDPIAGGIIGGVLGGALGGAIGGRRGAVAGAIIGGTTGVILGAQAGPGYEGYYWGADQRCYYQYPNGQIVRAPRRNCM
jgi:hypothetical protein